MSYNDLSNIFIVGNYLVYALWLLLFIQLCRYIYGKNLQRLKLTVLYCLNTSVFIVVAGYVFGLGIIVQAPITETFEESVTVLRSNAYSHFRHQLLFSSVVIAILATLNYVYMRFVMKEVQIRIMVKLGVAQMAILLAGSVLACSLFFVGLMWEINNHFDTAFIDPQINNVEIQSDSSLSGRIETGRHIWISQPLSHLSDTTVVTGNAIIFLEPDSARWENLWAKTTRGLGDADSDFSIGITTTLNEMVNDSGTYRNIGHIITGKRYISLSGCTGCPMLIDRDTINYGIILTGTDRIPWVEENRLHSWSYSQELKEFFELK